MLSSSSKRTPLTRRTFLARAIAGSGAILAATSASPVSVQPDDGHSAFVNVKAAPYNALGDGETDDAAAIQRALDDTEKAGGGWVFLPAGVYAITKTLLLRDNVNISGAGAFNATLLWIGEAGQPMVTDSAFGKRGASAFGKVILSDFGLDGNRDAGIGIASTAYYSLFDNLFITACRTDAMRFGFDGLKNYASQNQITRCRVADCGGAAINLDIHSVDSCVAECYLHDCDYGVLIKNGGSRIANNDIFGNRIAAIALQQTVNTAIISGNDMNANQREAITVTRTTTATEQVWGQALITDNSIVEDGLQADNTYDAIRVETNVTDGLAAITIMGNKIAIGQGKNRYRYGINLVNNVRGALCANNYIVRAGTAPYNIGDTCHEVEIDTLGNVTLQSPPMPKSAQLLLNPFFAPVTVYIYGGQVSTAQIGSVPFGFAGGAIRLRANETISLKYERIPFWTWVPD